MRTMLRITIPAEKGNQAITSGTLQRVIPEVLAKLKPEAAYFGLSEGKRGGFVVFDLADPSQLPPILEPLFQALNAEVELTPVMNAEDLTKGLGSIQGAASANA